MSKKQWIITAAVVLAIVTALCVFYVPRSVERTVNLPDSEPLFIQAFVSDEVNTIIGYKTEDAEEMAAFLAALQPVEMRYINRKSVYEVGEVGADVFIRYEDGSDLRIYLSNNGAVRYDNKNYKCNDPAALKGLLPQIESWASFGG